REGPLPPPPDRPYLPPTEWRQVLGGRRRVEAEGIDILDDAALAVTSYSTEGLALRDASAAGGPLTAVPAQLAGSQRQGARLVVVASGPTQRTRTREPPAGHDRDAPPRP